MLAARRRTDHTPIQEVDGQMGEPQVKTGLNTMLIVIMRKWNDCQDILYMPNHYLFLRVDLKFIESVAIEFYLVLES